MKYYISTAIAYASSKPHIGNTYEIVLADAIARYKRQQGYDVYFQTGTDEHGQKIEDKANAAGMAPQSYVDDKTRELKEIWDIMNTSYDAFVRTTNPEHKKVVQKIFKKLYDQGDIYKGRYEGNYCKPCEAFFTDTQLLDGKCPDCGREVVIASEEAYFFKITKYADRLISYIDSHPDFIQPISRKNEIINNFIKPGLQDLCVSRTSFKWGVPVDFDDKHVVYVWIDALSNYITFLGYDLNNQESEMFKKYWPADLQLIGKDILRFHAIYWPILLMALDVELPHQIFAHPWVLFGNDKMSKSKGNILYADDLVKDFGVDAVRYYLLHEIPYASDGNFTKELLIERTNADLANVLGNLVNRTVSMVHKYFDGLVPEHGVYTDIDKELINTVLATPNRISDKMVDLHIADAIDEVFEIFRRCNKYIDETTPWSLAKEGNQERLKTVLYVLLEAIGHGAILISPFLPETSEKILDQIGNRSLDINSFENLKLNVKLPEPQPLFNRIDKEKAEALLKK